MRKVFMGTLQRRRDGMWVNADGIDIYIPIGDDEWAQRFGPGTALRVIFEPAIGAGFFQGPDPVETESGHTLDPLSATIVQEIGMFAPPPVVLEEVRDFLTDWLEQSRGDDDSGR